MKSQIPTVCSFCDGIFVKIPPLWAHKRRDRLEVVAYAAHFSPKPNLWTPTQHGLMEISQLLFPRINRISMHDAISVTFPFTIQRTRLPCPKPLLAANTLHSFMQSTVQLIKHMRFHLMYRRHSFSRPTVAYKMNVLRILEALLLWTGNWFRLLSNSFIDCCCCWLYAFSVRLDYMNHEECPVIYSRICSVWPPSNNHFRFGCDRFGLVFEVNGENCPANRSRK